MCWTARVWLAAASFTFALYMAQAATAQSVRDEALRACAENSDEARRLACFDSLVPPPPLPTPTSGNRLGAAEARSSGPDHAPIASSSAQPPLPGAQRRDAVPTAGTVTIVEIRRPRIGQPSFVAADGRVFRQNAPGRVRFPPVPFEAGLEPGANASFFLASPLGGSKLRVAILERQN